MNKMILTLAAAFLAAGTANAAPAPSINDRVAELCAVSNTDLEGQRLARSCRAEVRARFAAEQRAEARTREVRTADATPHRGR
ncbi:hypothetical protein [Sphingomonas humi]